MKETKLKITSNIKELFEKENYQVPNSSLSLEQLIKRPEITIDFLNKLIEIPYSDEIKEQVSINLKYEGYIAKAYKESEKMLKLEKNKFQKILTTIKLKILHQKQDKS